MVAEREVDELFIDAPHALVLNEPDALLVVGVEDERAAFADALRNERFDVYQVFDVADAVLTDVIFPDVCDDGDVRPVVAESATHDAAARRLKHGDFDGRVREHDARGVWAGRVAARDTLCADMYAVGGRHAHTPVHLLKDVTDHARDG